MLSEKAPSSYAAHLGALKGRVWGIYDLSQLPEDVQFLGLQTPTKKSGKKYTNYNSIVGNKAIESIYITDIDTEKLEIFASLENLKYLQISDCRQEDLPDLSSLKSLEVLVLSSLTKVNDVQFCCGLPNLKTLYIYNIPCMTDLMPITELNGTLTELSLHHGMMSGTGTPVKNMNPIAALTNLQYLSFCLNIKDGNYDIASLLGLQKLVHLEMLPRYLKDGRGKQLLEKLPGLKYLNGTLTVGQNDSRS